MVSALTLEIVKDKPVGNGCKSLDGTERFLMATLVTFIAPVKDWKALQNLHQGALIENGKNLGATRYQVFRNAMDAAQAMVMVELSSFEDAQEMAQLIDEQLAPILPRGVKPAELWEPVGWEVIA